jgi:hypothetical protein
MNHMEMANPLMIIQVAAMAVGPRLMIKNADVITIVAAASAKKITMAKAWQYSHRSFLDNLLVGGFRDGISPELLQGGYSFRAENAK